MLAAFSAPVVKGWCPGLFAPMQAADGWLVRVRPPLGRMTAGQADRLADAAEQEGNGQISLTSRSNVQLRGFGQEAAHAFAPRMVAAGLGLADREAERRVALQMSPLADRDPACAVDTTQCAAALRSGLIAASGLSALPDKFGFCVDGGGLFPIGTMQADIMLQAAGGGVASASGWRVVCGSACSVPQTVPEAVQTALALAAAFAQRPERQRPLRDPALGEKLFSEIGAAHQPAAVPERKSANPPIKRAGFLTGSCHAVAAPLGRLTAATLRACADVARAGDGILRLTPWGGLIFGGLEKTPEISGMITHPDDPRLHVYACIGTPGCAQAAADVERAALAIAPLLPQSATVHVSGCRKGCAHPAPATLTLVAGVAGYSVVLHGRAGDAPTGFVPDNDVKRAVLQALPEGSV